LYNLKRDGANVLLGLFHRGTAKGERIFKRCTYMSYLRGGKGARRLSGSYANATGGDGNLDAQHLATEGREEEKHGYTLDEK